MTTFILDVLKDLKNNHSNLAALKFILPSKRAGLFLKHELSKIIQKPIFSPEIISIESFIEELSALKTVSNTELLFEFYSTYQLLTNKDEADSFESFSKWAQILIQDFNEIDRYLIPQEHIFGYLSAIQDLKHWSLENNQTDFVKNYLSFWKRLPIYYAQFKTQLLNNKTGYQGLVYRQAVEKLTPYIKDHLKTQHVFLGFNALNTAEETIIQQLLEKGLAKIYWDIDTVFMENPIHDAALFTRGYKKNWSYFKENPFSWITNNYSESKKIHLFGIPKSIGQAKHIGTLINTIKNEKQNLNHTAVILGDENLLIPVLNSLPPNLEALNITMGFPLKSIPLASLFEILFNIHKKNSPSFYFKDVIGILSNQFIRPLFKVENIDFASKIIDIINDNNLIYLSVDKLERLSPKHHYIIALLFSNWNGTVDLALKNCFNLISAIKSRFDADKNAHLLSLEYLFRFNELFNELTRLNTKYKHLQDIHTLHGVYKELLNSETLDFQGEPLQGLQIMGMLESRVLDFETVIISSVNEGILPAGKSNNSFIPYDVKLENKLPTYKEKDAVYTYHFYRLLQRAKNIYILYNTEADVLTGGEKSRFITQLELEPSKHEITHQLVLPKVTGINVELQSIYKDGEVLIRLKDIANKGFSPSSLTNYIRNPLDFYYQKILNIKEYEDVEETVAANTLGTVVHNTLEDFYKPLVGSFLSVDTLKAIKKDIPDIVSRHFKEVYKEGDISKGKNLIIFEIAKRYVSNFLDMEINDLDAGNQIKIMAIEADNRAQIDIPELEYPIFITGKIDRVDEFNGLTRIVDYKTGRVEQSQVEVVNWEDITTDYTKYSKSFQILTYAYIMCASQRLALPFEAGIISFKNLSSGFLAFAKKDKYGPYAKKEFLINHDTLLAFETELKRLVLEICNPKINFIEKDIIK